MIATLHSRLVGFAGCARLWPDEMLCLLLSEMKFNWSYNKKQFLLAGQLINVGYKLRQHAILLRKSIDFLT